jgi:hypothetical protein
VWPDDSRMTRIDQLRTAARLLAFLWAAWWTFYVWADVGGNSIASSGSGIATVLSLLLIGTASVAWQWERSGAVLLLIEGLLGLIGFPLLALPTPAPTLVFLLLIIAAPPLLAGATLLYTSWAARHARSAMAQRKPAPTSHDFRRPDHA